MHAGLTGVQSFRAEDKPCKLRSHQTKSDRHGPKQKVLWHVQAAHLCVTKAPSFHSGAPGVPNQNRADRDAQSRHKPTERAPDRAGQSRSQKFNKDMTLVPDQLGRCCHDDVEQTKLGKGENVAGPGA